LFLKTIYNNIAASGIQVHSEVAVQKTPSRK
jgi:hypothetical protein